MKNQQKKQKYHETRLPACLLETRVDSIRLDSTRFDSTRLKSTRPSSKYGFLAKSNGVSSCNQRGTGRAHLIRPRSQRKQVRTGKDLTIEVRKSQMN